MVNLTGHEAGNGGHGQGTPKALRAFLYSETYWFGEPHIVAAVASECDALRLGSGFGANNDPT